MSFFADPSPDPMEQEQIIAATTVLDVALRDILREDLGQTYTVRVDLSQPLPQRGVGHIEVRVGAAPENLPSMTAPGAASINACVTRYSAKTLRRASRSFSCPIDAQTSV